MRAPVLVAVASLVGLLGARWYFSSDSAPKSDSPPLAAAEATSPEVIPPRPSPDTVSAAILAPIQTPAPDAEQVLRELEPLSVTDKPAALARALAADTQLSPVGVMAEARRALIVTLMVDTGRMPEARTRAREFIGRYPQSRYVTLVQGVTGIHPRPRPSESRDAR